MQLITKETKKYVSKTNSNSQELLDIIEQIETLLNKSIAITEQEYNNAISMFNDDEFSTFYNKNLKKSINGITSNIGEYVQGSVFVLEKVLDVLTVAHINAPVSFVWNLIASEFLINRYYDIFKALFATFGYIIFMVLIKKHEYKDEENCEENDQRDLTDDEAVIIMVDSNLQREEILPSEKAFAYKMKFLLN